MKEIKKLFYTYRNGAVADTLRRYGIPHKIIFGLEIPRIAEISRSLEPSMELAVSLWNDVDVRESRLLATYLFPLDQIDLDTALLLSSQTRTQEESDMLAFRVLKRLSFAPEIAARLEKIAAEERNDDSASARTLSVLKRHLS